MTVNVGNPTARLSAALETAREALEPFAKEARFYDPAEQDGNVLDDEHEVWGDCELTTGDLRKARASLAKLSATKGESPPATPKWPAHCLHPNSCARHGRCGYAKCRYEFTDIKADILAATKGDVT